MDMILMDGPLGTELLARGVPTPLPGWSAYALLERPEIIAAIHRDYAKAGASVHTANTFRTKRRTFPEMWKDLARLAIKLVRSSVPSGHRVAGSIAPLEDCYRPDLSPLDSREEHRELAELLATAGVDILLCETFPHPGEALVAVEESVRTGVETWVSFTPGPRGDLLTPAEVAGGARAAAELGARAALVNCLPVPRVTEYISAMATALFRAGHLIPIGAYANTGSDEGPMGFLPRELPPASYALSAREWMTAGATIIGGCCGTRPAHIEAVGRLLLEEDDRG